MNNQIKDGILRTGRTNKMDYAKEQHKVNASGKENIADKEPCKGTGKEKAPCSTDQHKQHVPVKEHHK
jgi:hypothetical protein